MKLTVLGQVISFCPKMWIFALIILDSIEHGFRLNIPCLSGCHTQRLYIGPRGAIFLKLALHVGAVCGNRIGKKYSLLCWPISAQRIQKSCIGKK